MTHILLVEDDHTLARPLIATLEREGFTVDHAPTAGAAEARVGAADLVLLDWRLPDEPGVDLLRRWRSAGVAVPVLLVSARSELVDRVVGLELGADDYIVKPFESAELIARIRARLRTHGSPTTTRVGAFTIDETTRTIRFQGAPVDLTRMEYALLRFGLANPHTVFGRDELLTAVWGYAPRVASRTVDTHVRQLRQKVSAEVIETVRGVGYRFKP